MQNLAIEKSFPFKAKIVDSKADRLYTDDDFTSYFKQFISNGVYGNPSNQLKVVSLNNNMQVTVYQGAGFINGRGYMLTEADKKVTINNSTANNRRDIIVLRSDPYVTRSINIIYRAGTAGTNPVKPTLVRTSDIWELELAEILVRANSTSILQTDITDSRLNNAVCGLVTGLIQQVDTSSLFNSYQSALTLAQNNINITIGQYNSWLTQIQNQFEDKRTFVFTNPIYKKGMILTTSKSGNTWTETWKFKSDNSTYATRTTTKVSVGNFTEKTICTKENIDITATIKKVGTTWTEEII